MLADKLLFNTFIRTFIAGYIVFALSSFISLKALTSESSISNILVTYATVFLVVFSPFVSAVFLIKYKEKLDTPKFKDRVNTLYIE